MVLHYCHRYQLFTGSQNILQLIGCIGIVSLILSPIAHAKLTIKSGSTVTLTGTASLDLNCEDIIIESGGTLTLNSGTVEDVNSIVKRPGSTYSNAGSVIKDCGTFFIIRTPAGKTAVIAL